MRARLPASGDPWCRVAGGACCRMRFRRPFLAAGSCFLSASGGGRQVLREVGDVAPEFAGDEAEGVDGDVAFSPFDAAVVAAVEFDVQRKAFLRVALPFAFLTDALPKFT